MRKYLIGCFLVFCFVCYTYAQSSVGIRKDWKLLSGCGVTLTVPDDVSFVEDQSVDTCERYYKGNSTSIHVTVTEWNVGQTSYSNWPDHCVTKLLLDSKNAEIVTSIIPVSSDPNKGRDFSAMLLVPDFCATDEI